MPVACRVRLPWPLLSVICGAGLSAHKGSRMGSRARRKGIYAETDGKVYLVKESGSFRFPNSSERLPFEYEDGATMRLRDADVLMVKPLLDRYPEEWLGRDDALERTDVDSVVKNAIYMTMMRCVSELAIPDGDKVLMVKAKRGFSLGYWNLPGGFMQYGETPETACARETKEETGVEVAVDGAIGTYVSTFPDKPAYTLGFVYEGKVLSTQFRPKEDEIERVEWQLFDRGLELTRNPFAKWGIVDLYRRLPERQANVKVYRHGLLKSRGASREKGSLVFLDRDGVINRSRPGYVKKPEEFEFLPGAIEGMRRLCAEGFRLAIVSNQDVMGWKIIDHEGLRRIHNHMIKQIENDGARIEELYYCPHHILSQCRCHKPKPAMLLAAARDLDITPRQSWMVGDKVSDIVVGKSFGCWTAWIADTRRRKRYGDEARRARPDRTCNDLRSAAEEIAGTDIGGLTYRAREL